MNLSRSMLVASAITVAVFSMAPVGTAHAADNVSNGNPVAGVCLLSREAVFAQSRVGQAASARLQQLGQQAHSQLEAERAPLQSAVQSFQQKESSLSEAERKQQGSALQDRLQTFKAQAEVVDERIQLTRSKAMQTIGQDAQPIVASTYGAHHCGLLLNRDAVLAGNMTNDLTADVVKGLDQKVTTISFSLEPMPAKAQNQSSTSQRAEGHSGH